MIIEDVAKLCHQTNKAYCESIGDFSQQNWDEAPDWQKESAINGVNFHLKEDRLPEESHLNWMKKKIDDGWVYGPVKSFEKKTHPCIVSYKDLPQEQRAKDYIFKSICDFFREKEKALWLKKESLNLNKE